MFPGFIRLSIVVALVVSQQPAQAQGTTADYERAEGLRELVRGKVFKTRVRAHWFDDNNAFWYRNDMSGGRREFIRVDAGTGVRRRAFDHERVAALLAEAAGAAFEAERLPFEEIQFDAEGRVRFNAAEQGWRYDPSADTLSSAERLPDRDRSEGRRRRSRRGRSSARSPDGRWEAEIRDHNVFLKAISDNEAPHVALTTDGTPDHGYETRFYWSADSRKFVALKTRNGERHTVHLIESRPDDQEQPKLHSFDYRKPGDRIPLTKPRLFDVENRRAIPLDDALFPNPWRISDVRWWDNLNRFTFLYNQRGHQVLRIVAVDADSGAARALIDERSATFIDYAHKEFTASLPETREIIWMSERDGWNHLYLYDAVDGKVKNQITRGKWVVRGVDRVDEVRRQIWFRAGGIVPGQDPYYVHYCRVDFDGGGLVVLTEGNGTHEVSHSPDRRHLIDTWSRVDAPPVTELRRSENGSLICELERADWSELLDTGWKPPEPFVAKGRDGCTPIYGLVFRPSGFDGSRRYPVIEHIYAGPHGAFVPKRFSSYHAEQALAELGFVVVKIDGMGTSHRSKAFHDVCWKNLKDSGFPDRKLWIQAAAERDKSLDLSRGVGIYGGSAGGQSTLAALLHHPDFYTVGVADCGCHDNRMDKIWWNELWMGWPIGPEYADNSNVEHAHRLSGKLLLTWGELDRNVDPASTMQVVDALIEADKDFELLIVPGAGHGVGDRLPYAIRRRRDFFVRHLLGCEPRAVDAGRQQPSVYECKFVHEGKD